MNKSLGILSSFVCLVTGCVSVGPGKSITTQLQRYGYTELRPPSRLAFPGTIVRITSRNPLQGNTVCKAETALGPRVKDTNFVAISEGPSGEMQRAFNSTFKLDAGYLDQIKANASFEAVKSIKFQLSNVRFAELPDTSVFKLIKERDPDCSKAIQFRRDQRQDLTMLNYALLGDAQYTISWNRKLEAGVKADITKQVAATLGVDVAWSGADTFKGVNLIWGVRDDANLLNITSSLLPTGAAPNHRLDPGQPLQILPE